MSADARLLDNITLVHGRATCDEGGRPLSRYLCEYHDGYEDGLDAADMAAVMDAERARLDPWFAYSFFMLGFIVGIFLMAFTA